MDKLIRNVMISLHLLAEKKELFSLFNHKFFYFKKTRNLSHIIKSDISDIIHRVLAKALTKLSYVKKTNKNKKQNITEKKKIYILEKKRLYYYSKRSNKKRLTENEM